MAAPNYLRAQNIVNPNDIFSNCSFLLLETANISRQSIDRYFSENHITVTPKIEINNTDFLLEFAKSGLGVTVVVKSFVEKELKSCRNPGISAYPPSDCRDYL